MATSTTTVWAKGFSEAPAGEPLSAKSIIEMLDLIGDEMVRAPGPCAADAPDAPILTRRELLARVLWTRAILDADNASTKLIIEYLDGKPGEAEAAPGQPPALNADDMALAETWLREDLGGKDTERGRYHPGVITGHGEEERLDNEHLDVR